ncbi:MAG: trigger factor [Deltaproteobacteria bacterium]|nr:trigger factor [Deltaproteobacteria bacterium]
MKVSVEELSTTRRKVAVELDPSDVEEQVERSYRELARSVQLKGFRPGRAPRTILKQLYGKEIDAEVTGKLIEETIPKALEENKLEPVTMPVIEDRELGEDRSFRYTALVEVQPDLELKDYRGIAVTAEAVSVASEDVDRALEQLRVSRATLVDRDGEVRRGDVVVADWDMEVDGKEGSQASRQDATLEIADGSLLPELVTGLEGAKAGETRTITANLGDRAPDPSMAGKTATFKVTVKKVQERVLPALDDELAKAVSGLESVDALRADVETKIRARLERDAKAKQHEQIVDALVEANPFDAPESLVEQSVRSLTRFSGAEVPEGESEEAREERKGAIEKAAKRQVCADLLLRRIADKESISVTEDDVNAELDERASAIGQDGRVLRAAYEKKGILDEIRGDLRRRRTLDFLLESANISGK